MAKKPVYPQDKIIRSRAWKWITIAATILGIVTAGWFFYDKLTKDPYTIEYEQRLSPEAMESLEGGESIEKGVIITPRGEDDESGSGSD